MAELLGLAHRNTVSVYQRRYPNMPRPVVDLGSGREALAEGRDPVLALGQSKARAVRLGNRRAHRVGARIRSAGFPRLCREVADSSSWVDLRRPNLRLACLG